MKPWKPFENQINQKERNPYGKTIERFKKRPLMFIGWCCATSDLSLARILRGAKIDKK